MPITPQRKETAEMFKFKTVTRSTYLVICLGVFVGCMSTDHYVKQDANFSRFKRAAVLPFAPPPEVPKEQASGICEGVADIVAMQLLKKGWDVVERARVQAIFEERNLEISEFPVGTNLDKVRQLLAVDCFVTGAITEWREFIAFRNDGGVGITIKIYDGYTGQLVWSGSGSSTVTLLDDKRQSYHAQRIIKDLCNNIPAG